MKRLNNLKAVIFDLDDTLYPEKEFVMSGFKTVTRYLSKKYKLNSSKIFNILKFDSEKGLRGKNFDLLLKKLKLPKEELKKLITIYRNHQPKIKLYPDAKELLKYLIKNKNFKLGLISNGLINTQKNKLRALNINNIFDKIILGDSLGKKYRKPHQRSFGIILKKLKIQPTEAVYVADNPQKDFLGAKKLGIFTIRIKKKGGIYKNVRETIDNEADLTVSDLLKLKNLW